MFILASDSGPMQSLNLPPYEFRIRNKGQSKEIFDCVRRKFVALTPEEWVRQHFVRFLSEELGYPLSLMTLEKGLEVNQMRKRTDLVVHNRSGQPWMIVECKAPTVVLTSEALYQASMYHETLSSTYLTVTNGLKHFCCEFIDGSFHFLNELPPYPTT
ncbi:MAG TPA: type I restriction enzyme HsdR N-terminal domain-containing protein [Bacteroidia bacterium]|nr:type I restriction enzyme HsdR N-terminal domain-containing protein [Bacteroidia bacterium]